MSLTRPQIWLLKTAQRQAGITDEEYRRTLWDFFAVTTSKDRRLGDEHLDTLLAYWEAIYWRAVDAKQLQPPCTGKETFRQRGYWASKNQAGHTSRDRHNLAEVAGDIATLETSITGLGFGVEYLASIRRNTCGASSSLSDLILYRAALKRTLDAKTRRPKVS